MDEFESRVEVVSKLLEDINPRVSADEWMRENLSFDFTYINTQDILNSTLAGRKFKEALIEFDKAVNPFLDEDIELDEVSNYLKKVSIGGFVDNSNQDQKNGYCNLKIISGNSETSYDRNPDGFQFRLSYELEDCLYLEVTHGYNAWEKIDEDNGEYISIRTVLYDIADDCERKDFYYNITNNTFGTSFDINKMLATKDDISKVYFELLEAIEYAREITYNNMKKGSRTK